MAYPDNVFINCPFDAEFDPLRNAMVFAIFDCGYEQFKRELPLMCAQAKLQESELTYTDFSVFASTWAAARPLRMEASPSHQH